MRFWMECDCGMDWVEAVGVETVCVLGVYPGEREMERPVRMDVAAGVDAGAAAQDDDFSKALNYERLEEIAVRTAKEGSFRLLETLAVRVAEAVLSLPGVRAARVRAEKPGALKASRCAAVTVVRRKADRERSEG
jgi:dihydroneopterin aldolase